LSTIRTPEAICFVLREPQHIRGEGERRWKVKSKIVLLLEKYGYTQDAEPTEYDVRYWASNLYSLTVSIVNGIWESCDDVTVKRGTCGTHSLRGLELSILRSEKSPPKHKT
jgi:hypothetical protein